MGYRIWLTGPRFIEAVAEFQDRLWNVMGLPMVNRIWNGNHEMFTSVELSNGIAALKYGRLDLGFREAILPPPQIRPKRCSSKARTMLPILIFNSIIWGDEIQLQRSTEHHGMLGVHSREKNYYSCLNRTRACSLLVIHIAMKLGRKLRVGCKEHLRKYSRQIHTARSQSALWGLINLKV